MITLTITVRRYASGVITRIIRIPAHLMGITAPPGLTAACLSALDHGTDGGGVAGAATASVAATAIAADTPTADAGMKDVVAMVVAFPMPAAE